MESKNVNRSMSNYLAIVVITSTFKKLLERASRVVENSKVTIGKPKDTASANINIFLYQVMETPHLQNIPLDESQQLILDLYYLLTFYGEESEMEAQRLMGSALSLLHANPVLKKDDIKSVIRKMPHVVETDFIKYIERVKLMPHILVSEELSQLWSRLFQTPYVLSTTYLATPVIIDTDSY